MGTKEVVLSICLCLVVTVAVAKQSETRLSEARQCRFQRLSTSQPSQKIESEGGLTEIWDEEEDQFQCAGVAAMKNTIRPNSLSLPAFHSSPKLAYIEKGSGLLGINFPGCAETFHSHAESWRPGQSERQQKHGRRDSDQHQKVQRIRQGDIIAIPAGVTHWCYNNGNDDLVAVIVHDLNNQANQLDQKFRSFYLAGSVPRQGRRGGKSQESFQNIFRAFDEELMAEAFNVNTDIIRKIQKEDERGLIVKVRGDSMRVISPREDEEEQQGGRRRGGNGIEETWCTIKNRHNIDKPEEAEVYTRQAGRINVANQHTLPALAYIDMSAEKGTLYPNAIYSPHWSMSGHSVIYVTRGDAQVQVIGSNGEKIFDDKVNEGDMFVIPQFLTSMARAGRNGFEWVSMKTTSQPLKNPLVGYTSVIRGMPLQVLTNSYQIQTSEARELKNNRGGQTFLLSPSHTSY